MLTLPEQLALIALKDEKGSVLLAATEALPYSLLASVLFELFLENRIDFSGDKIELTDSEPTGDSLFDEILGFISNMKSSPKPKDLLLKLDGEVKNIKEKAIQKLVENEVLEEKKSKILGFIPRTTYPTKNPEPEKKLRDDLRKYVLEDKSCDERSVALLKLAKSSQLLQDIFNPSELKNANKCIESMLERENPETSISAESVKLIKLLGEAVEDAIGKRKLI